MALRAKTIQIDFMIGDGIAGRSLELLLDLVQRAGMDGFTAATACTDQVMVVDQASRLKAGQTILEADLLAKPELEHFLKIAVDRRQSQRRIHSMGMLHDFFG